MKRFRKTVLLPLTIALLGSFVVAQAQQRAPKPTGPAPMSDFIGVEYIDETPSALVVAIPRYSNGEVIVDFIGTVHVADASLYSAHTAQFKEYEVVLLEGVKTTPTIPARQSPLDMLGALYQQSAQQMQLSLQSDHIKRADNFVHSDVTDVELSQAWQRAMTEQGETELTLLASAGLELFKAYIRQQDSDEPQGNPLEELLGQQERVVPLKLKRDSVEMMTSGQPLGNFLGSFGNSLNGLFQKSVVDFRNRKAIDTLKQQLLEGRKSIGIYWGAAHGPGMDFILRTELGFVRQETVWLIAWDMKSGLGEVAPPFPLPSK